MKLLISIVNDQDADELEREFVKNNIGVTKLSSSGGFLRQGNVTFISGVDDKKVDSAIQILKDTCSSREELMVTPTTSTLDYSVELGFNEPRKIQVGGGIVFVVDVEEFIKL